MTAHAVQVLESDFDSEANKLRKLGGVLLRRQYLKNIGVTHQTLWNWRTGRCGISRRAALRIEDRTGGRVRSENLLARGEYERVERGDCGVD